MTGRIAAWLGSSRKDLIVHGSKDSGVAALDGMHEGAMVVIHYTIESGEPTVREIDLERAETGTASVVIYYKDEKGQKVVHFFKKAS